MAATSNLVPVDGATAQSLKMAEQTVRVGFIRKVYGILCAQLLLTMAIAFPISRLGPQFVATQRWLLYVSAVMTLMTICSMACCRSVTRKFPQNYMLLFVFTGFQGVMVGFITAMYTWQSVVVALGMTSVIFFGMTLYACTTKTDFTGLGPYLMGALIASLGVCFVLGLLTLAGFQLNAVLMLYDAGMALLFTMYIVYDTQLIIGGSHKVKFEVDDYVMGALQLYLDIINLFLHLLKIFGQRK